MQLQPSDIFIIIAVILVAALGGMVWVGKKNYAKNLEAQSFINQYKMVTPILIIDKRMARPTPENLPKAIYEKMPKAAKLRKMPIVKAKVGPQITTLLCDKSVYDNLPVKKTVKVELAGVYISSIVGMNLENKKNKTIREKIGLWAKKNMNQK